MKRWSGAISLVAVLAASLPAIATIPDPETYAYIKSRYSLLLHEGRDGCAYYANPKAIAGRANQRRLPVLLASGVNGGSMCNGMFEFRSLLVDCDTNLITYTDTVGSPADWKSQQYVDPDIIAKVCPLSFQTEKIPQ